jgi:hypothetical protein
MACTEADFHRLLPAAFPGVAWDAATRSFNHGDGWTLRLGVPRERRIAGLCLPVMDVAFEFRGLDAGRVLERFFMYFQRGGG